MNKVCAKHPELNGLRRHRECVGCHRERRLNWDRNNPRANRKRPDAVIRQRVRRALDPVGTKKKDTENYRIWYQSNKERAAATDRAWVSMNRDKVREYARVRYDLMNSQPISKARENQIRAIYRNCPLGYEVDHVIPLRGRGVCGLHVPWNLQYLTKSENRKKSNKLEVANG